MPIDAAFPDDRIDYMLQDASIRCIVTDANTADRLERLEGCAEIAVITLENVSDAIGPVNEANDSDSTAPIVTPAKVSLSRASIAVIGNDLPCTAASDRAYIVYTSGSTGQPKGVPISHGDLACYCRTDVQANQLQSEDRTLQFATLSFDISIEEIFPPLMIWSTVVLRPSARSEVQIELSDIIERYRVTALHLATGYWHEWVGLKMAISNMQGEPITR